MKNIGFNITRPSIINVVNKVAYTDLSNSLCQSYKLYTLNGKNIVNIETFLSEFSDQILTKGKADNLSNFEDHFFQYLVTCPEVRSAFIWTEVDNMLKGALLDLITFSDILSSITRKLYKHGRTHINILVGSDINFPMPIQL